MQQQKIYFEKQSLRRCGLHAVNNLLQYSAYNHESFQIISKELSKQSQLSHSTSILGNYDYNVIESALLKHKKQLKWHKGEQVTVEDLKQENLFGILLNISKEQSYAEKMFNLESKHWIAIRKFDNELFVYLDSKLENYIEFSIPYLVYRINDILKDKQNSRSHILWVLNMKTNT